MIIYFLLSFFRTIFESNIWAGSSQEEYSKWGFTMNIAKTKYMPVGTDTNHLEMDNGDIITGCTEFRYLATIFTKDGRDIT